MIEVRPDPAHPQGGFALLEAGSGTLGETAAVEVFDSFAGRYLGPGGWQATRFAFGPYPVEHGAGADRLRVGPEIVNRLTEYQPLRLTLGPVSADLSWPDDVVPSPDAALSGGIWTAPAATPTPTAAPPKPPKTAPVEVAGVDTPLPEPEKESAPPVPDPVPVPPSPGRRTPLLIGGLAILALLAGGAAYFLTRPDPTPVVATTTETETPPPSEPAGPDCSAAALETLGAQGFGPVLARIGDCGNAITQDEALGLVEKAAQANDPAALTVMGQLYDSASTEAVLETSLQLSASDNPAQAAEYYDRAARAGSAEATPLLRTVCERLSTMTDTLSQSAHEDHCGS